jgi:serine/threonine protein kinase
MLLGLAHCHSVNVVHRDVKPDNFLVGGENGQTIKLCDFGLSTCLSKNCEGTGVFGTAPFMCPEMLKGISYNEKADVWSFAVLTYALLLGTFPYLPKQQSAKKMKEAIVEGNPSPSFEPSVRALGKRSDVALSFCKALLVRNPAKRPSAQEGLNLPWMIAAMQGSHMVGEDLISLRPALHCARKVGAFEMRDTVTESSVDIVLNSLQMEHQGVPLSVSQKAKSRRASNSSKDSTASGRPSPSPSLKANKELWEVRSNPSVSSRDSDDGSSGSVFSGWSRGTEQISNTTTSSPLEVNK